MVKQGLTSNIYQPHLRLLWPENGCGNIVGTRSWRCTARVCEDVGHGFVVNVEGNEVVGV